MNTSSNCATESIFDSPSFLYNTAHILTIFTLPINFFGVYLVYSKTPPLMTNMKMVMINMQIWIMLSDFCIGTLVIPYIYFPVFAVSTFGILNKLNVGIAPQFYLLVFSIGEIGASMAITLENRKANITRVSYISMTNKRKLLITINYLLPFVFQLPFYFNLPDQNEAMIEISRKIPCLSSEFHTSPVIVISTNGVLPGFSICAILFAYAIEIGYFITNITNVLVLDAKVGTLSNRTKQFQRKIFFLSCVQIFVPLLTTFVPVLRNLISIAFFSYDQAFTNLSFLIMSLHGFVATVVTIIIYKPYRNYTFRVPFSLLGVYCIVIKTPKSMKIVKYYLLNVHICSNFLDFLMSTMIIPIVYLPTLSGCSTGFFNMFKVPVSFQLFIAHFSIHMMANSICALFENRSSSIPNNIFRIKTTKLRVTIYSFYVFLTSTYMIPTFLSVNENQEISKLYILSKIKCPTEDFFKLPIHIWTMDIFWIRYIFISISFFTILTLSQLIFFTCCCIYYLYIHVAKNQSSRTRKLQRHFFVGSVVHVLTPFLFCVIPIFIQISFYIYEYYNQTWNNLCVFVFQNHGFASTLIVLFCHQPYRLFIFSHFSKSKKVAMETISVTAKGTI
ncbi:unnamed protein product [Caenorhabditis angaria]|uniref:Serpentine Receptor, class H n=1 Tax=Caenorhabditis angaria TaxID=860376 RepID=A0A9P1IW06_9PELO|nr:unnamed protein product [Caenorhabditis angaria]